MFAAATLGVVLLGVLAPAVASFAVGQLLRPVHATNVWLEESSAVVPQFFRDRQALVSENESLKTQLAEARSADLTGQYFHEENLRLRELLGRSTTTRIAAGVIARPSQLPYDVLQVDQGSEAGVVLGAPVYVDEAVVIGVVSYVHPSYALVELISKPGFQSTVFIGGPDVVAPLEGQGAGAARVRVPQGIALQVGNIVTLPSIGTGVLGRIVAVDNEPTQPEQYGHLTLPVPILELHSVTIGLPQEIKVQESVVEEVLRATVAQQLVITDVPQDFLATSTATSTPDSDDETIGNLDAL